MNIPKGFLFAAATAGIKASGNPDLALAEAPKGASAAALFTTNRVVAAPVVVGRKHLGRSAKKLRAVLVNSGNANCATGAAGMAAAEAICKKLAKQLDCKARQVVPSSTGIIGVPLPTEKILAALPGLVAGRSAEKAADFARAIMTTDTRPKTASATFAAAGGAVSLLGMAKGAGMIHPRMATMLAYVFTDIVASPKELQRALRQAADESFNAISIDGDTSTNDTVLLMASGSSGVPLKKAGRQFQEALLEVCLSLSRQIVADGEGVQHVITLRIEQARSKEEARAVARSIANSPLVKTAWAGADPNWGRMLAAAGYSGVALDPERINIFIGEQQVCRKGVAHPFDGKAAHEHMSRPEYEIGVQLGRGKDSLCFFTCDLTSEYVKINADYST